MGQRAPTVGQIAVAVAFAFSCFGLLLFLWATFGGPVPLKPEGYRIKVPFTEATQLAQESDVRIHNVSVGKVKSITLANSGPNKDLAVATLEIDTPYAPIPANTRAMLRQKTLLGETYVELTPGRSERAEAPGGRNPAQGAGGAVRAAGRDLQDLRCQDPRRVPDVDATARHCELRARCRPLRRDRQPRAVRRGREQGAARAGYAAGRGPAAGSQHRRGLRGPQRAAGPAPGPDPKLGHRLPHHGRAQPGPRGHLPGAADVPRRVQADAQPARQLLAPRKSGRHPAPSLGEGAQRRPQADRQGDAGLQGLLRGPAQDAEAGPDRAAGPPDAAQQRSPAPAHRSSIRSRSSSRRSSRASGATRTTSRA